MSGRVVDVRDNVPAAIYIGRPNHGLRIAGSLWGNPFRIGTDGDRAEVIAKFCALMERRLATNPGWAEVLVHLRGKPLACWCRRDGEERTPDNACHGDVLIDLLERYTDDQLRAMGEVTT